MGDVSPSTHHSRSRRRAGRNRNPLLSEQAVGIAREALEELGEGEIGAHVGVSGLGTNVATHRFGADVPGYAGWEWQAVVACAEGSRHVTVNEVALVPAKDADALQAPDWVPYADRVRPGDLGPGDLMPPEPDDPRLDEEGNLTDYALKEAEKRWRTGEFGPGSEMAAKAPLQCKTCAFYASFRPNFGVCVNEYSADQNVVHATYGCGAHSKTKVSQPEFPPIEKPYDDERPIF